ncbi:MAG: hypothetical protein BWY75_03078 [bacterium ADurb.Bin425]|nr:MAG: hypothetical protein BWY75_03078 [bacterium ADurb.Bin425]
MAINRRIHFRLPGLNSGFSCTYRLITKFRQKTRQFIITTMNIADDIKGTALLFAVVPKFAALYLYVLDFFRAFQHIDLPKALVFQTRE